ncbi:hypothetical protein DFH06DRAFT_949667, partial [Mycena polygramma]
IWSLMERARQARGLWRTAVSKIKQTLEKSTTTEAAAGRIKAALKALENLAWEGDVKGFKDGTVDGLALWFTTDWLKTEHEEQMLELLASDLGLRDGDSSTIQSTYFVAALARAYSDPAAYRKAGHFRWLRRLGESFATKHRNRLGTIPNENEDHWIALAIDCEKQLVGYGNGFGTSTPASLRQHLDWWLFEHLGVQFKWKDLPVAKQTDGHSCGVLAYWTLAHWFDKEHFPLPKCTAASMSDERIKMFLRIVERHSNKLGDFASDARDYEFTF